MKSFALVLLLFVLEDVLVEIELKVLVGIIDAKLFETAREESTVISNIFSLKK